MKFSLRSKDGRGWPGYLPGGRIRTSTAALVVAFCALFWVYDTYQPSPPTPEAPATQVVPPGFVPDPEYTWVPRTNVRERPRTTVETTTPTTTTTTTEPGTPTTPESPTSETSPPLTPTPGEETTPSPAAPGPGPAPTTPPPPR